MMPWVWVGLFAPLAGFLFLLAVSSRISRPAAAAIGCATVFASLVCFAALLYCGAAGNVTLFDWIPVAGISAGFTLHLDSLALLMSLIITGVGFLIHVYSAGYTDHEEDYARYFACLNFFVFAMLLLVLAGHLLLLFVGWEGVGLASYLLIGYWYHRPAAAKAATKAFVVNRIGDLGLLLGLLLTFKLFGTGDIAQVCEKAGKLFTVGAPTITLLTLLFFVGAVGKSAQIPLHVWLPDAMEGPTPVSALIHAATMVTAGVYLVVRMHPVFLLAPATMKVIAVVGAATSIFAATVGTAQTDLKRVLAYSTVSQLGLMFLACGVGAFYAAMFHLTMHAFVKALLFLSAGNVVHMMHGSTDMNKMGGLAKIFTKTRWLFLVGALAMAGIPPLAAFFSKDLLLEQVRHHGGNALFGVGILVSALTAFYLLRAYFLTFTGKPRLEEKILKMVKEAPPVMTGPVSILCFLSVVGGFLGFGIKKASLLEHFLAAAGMGNGAAEGFQLTPEVWLSLGCAAAGIALAFLMYQALGKKLGEPMKLGFLAPVRELLQKAYFVDAIYGALIVAPLKAIAILVSEVFEPKVFDGSVRGVARGAEGIAGLLQKVQSGQIRSYVGWMAIGSVALLLFFLFQ